MLRSTKKSSTHFRITSPLRACPDFSSGGSRDGVNKQRSTANYFTPYKFSAKEKDEETSYSYFGARYLASDFSFWLSVDPMSDERSWLSPNNYCQWNPIKLTDPTGMLDDGYTVDETGNIQKVDKTGGNKFDVLFNKKDYDAGKREYDKSGKKNGIRIDRGEISNYKSKKIGITLPNEDVKIRKVDRVSCEIKSKDVADNLFNFLEKNTIFEWSNQNLTSPNGTSINVLKTSREGGKYATITGGYNQTLDYLNNGYILNSDDHSHPYDNPNGDGYIVSDSDKEYKGNLQKISFDGKNYPAKNAVFQMFFRGIPKKY